MSTATLDRIRSEVRDAAAVAEQHYAALVAELADVGNADAADVMEVLGDVGRTLDDLDRDVETLRARRRLAATMGQSAGAEVTSRAAADRIAELEREHARVVADFQARFMVLRQEQVIADEQIRRAKQARAQLVASVTGPRADRLTAARQRLTRANADVEAARRELDRVRLIVGEDERRIPEQAEEIGRRSYAKHTEASYAADFTGRNRGDWVRDRCRETQAEAEAELRQRVANRLKPHQDRLASARCAEADARAELVEATDAALTP